MYKHTSSLVVALCLALGVVALSACTVASSPAPAEVCQGDQTTATDCAAGAWKACEQKDGAGTCVSMSFLMASGQRFACASCGDCAAAALSLGESCHGGSIAPDAGADAAPAVGACPAVGAKACPNDVAVSTADVDACVKSKADAKCGAAYTSLLTCAGANAPCGADGKVDASKFSAACKAPIDVYTACVTPAGDAG